jgi:hypothetical protein
VNDIDLQIVRECFELNRFQVTTRWALQSSTASRDEHKQQLYVQRNGSAGEPPDSLVLSELDIPKLHRALIEVRVWHTERLYRSTLESTPIFTEFAERAHQGPALDFFGTDEFRNVLVLSALPQSGEQRAQVLELLEQGPIDHVIEYQTILRALADRVVDETVYSGSHTLQLIQTFKRYRMLRYHQLEFPFAFDSGGASPGDWIETAMSPLGDENRD